MKGIVSLAFRLFAYNVAVSMACQRIESDEVSFCPELAGQQVASRNRPGTSVDFAARVTAAMMCQ